MATIKCPKCGEKIENPSAGIVTCSKCGGKMKYTPKGEGNTQSATAQAQTKKSPTKKCKHCKSDIPFDANICPNCRKKQKSGGCLKWFLVIIVAIGVIGALAGNGNDDKESDVKNIESTAENNNNTQESEVNEKEEQEVDEQSKEEKELSKSEEESKSDTEFDYDDMHVKYTGHEIGENMAGEKCLIVYFEFTNNSKENKSFAYSFTSKVFQNGVELDHSMLFANDICKNRDNEIQPGTTITVGEDFVLGEDRSTSTLQVTPWISVGENILLENKLSLK